MLRASAGSGCEHLALLTYVSRSPTPLLRIVTAPAAAATSSQYYSKNYMVHFTSLTRQLRWQQRLDNKKGFLSARGRQALPHSGGCCNAGGSALSIKDKPPHAWCPCTESAAAQAHRGSSIEKCLLSRVAPRPSDHPQGSSAVIGMEACSGSEANQAVMQGIASSPSVPTSLPLQTGRQLSVLCQVAMLDPTRSPPGPSRRDPMRPFAARRIGAGGG
jgi:adhesin HecA-like repeat protein